MSLVFFYTEKEIQWKKFPYITLISLCCYLPLDQKLYSSFWMASQDIALNEQISSQVKLHTFLMQTCEWESEILFWITFEMMRLRSPERVLQEESFSKLRIINIVWWIYFHLNYTKWQWQLNRDRHSTLATMMTTPETVNKWQGERENVKTLAIGRGKIFMIFKSIT